MKLFLLLLIFWTDSSFAQKESTTIIADADLMEKNTPLKTLILKGNVNVIFQQQHLLCDEAVVYEATSTIVAKGNVVLQSARTTLRGDHLEYNYETNKGIIKNGIITSGQVLLEANEIIKIGENRYEADDAYFTSCVTCPPSWGFTSAHIDAEIGGYAYMKQPWLHLLQLPTLPLPYLVLPLNSKRQTGLLVPNFGNNPGGGFMLEFPFFWAIDRSHDATFSVLNYELRGQQIFGNYRFMASETSGGELNTSFMKDRVFGFQDRWFVNYKHHYDLPEGYTQRSAIALASDTYYPRDFPMQMQYYGQAALDNRNSISKALESGLLTIDSSYYFSLIEPGSNPDFPKITAANEDGLHRLPEINYHLLDQKLLDETPLYLSVDAQYLNIARQGLGFERGLSGAGNCLDPRASPEICYTSATDPQFVYGARPGQVGPYGDLIRTGQRLDLMTQIHAPFWVGDVLDLTPSLGFRYTQYALGVESDPSQGYSATPSRLYGQMGLSAKTYLSRVYAGGEENVYKHSIIPEIDVRYIPHVEQSDHNFFGTPGSLRYFREQQPIDNLDMDWRGGGRGIQFDNRDRIIGQQIATFAVTNKLLSRRKQPEKGKSLLATQYEQDLFFRVGQTLDLFELQRGDEARPWQSIETLLMYRDGAMSYFVTTETFPYHKWTNWLATTRYSFLNRNYISLSYNQILTPGLVPPVNVNSRNEALRVQAAFNVSYIELIGSMEFDLNPEPGVSPWTRWATKALITPPGDCWTLIVNLAQVLGRPEVQHSVSMEFRFDR